MIGFFRETIHVYVQFCDNFILKDVSLFGRKGVFKIILLINARVSFLFTKL